MAEVAASDMTMRMEVGLYLYPASSHVDGRPGPTPDGKLALL